jgi:geranylgeranyl diphosphate synthase type II
MQDNAAPSDIQADVQADFQDLRQAIDARLEALLTGESSNKELTQSIRYTLLAPGKRLRPLICLLTARCLGADEKQFAAALDAACAIEMVHTASLLIDDLPCMDDAELRRGRIACHRRFGEATTILTGFELLSLGTKVMSELPGADSDTRLRLVQILAGAVGVNGLIGGQERDLASEHLDEQIDTQAVTKINELKTGALFIAAAESGATIAGLAGDQLLPIRDFAARLGLAYQALDDLLDIQSTAQATGKDIRQDVDKSTLVGVLGSDAADEYASSMVAGAVAALRPLGPDMQPLESLVQSVVSGSANLRH